MRLLPIAFLAALRLGASSVEAAPFKLPNGFPNLSPSALQQVSVQAGGTLPNTPLPTSLQPDAIQTLQLIAANEIFEVAFFSSLLNNVTKGVKGYNPSDKSFIESALTRIVAQEQLHAIGANAILKSAGASEIPACSYKFPVQDFDSAIALAATFTDIVLGTLQSAQQTFALGGGQAASGLVPLLGSIIGQEGEQDGAYRFLQKKAPSAAPFLTRSAGPFAFNALAQTFIVKGSCDSVIKTLGIPQFETLATTGSKPQAKNSTLTFETSAHNVTAAAYSIAYISGQNTPVVVPITSVSSKGKTATFKANFPFANGFAKGLTIAALVKGKGPFNNPLAVANATIAGPGLIEVD